ncbi:MAG: 4-(cytidine 5'-diphospho)-2-C-methyl-D-erythritol kinase [Ignavibacteria bacterium]|nr:4-(cytidine 5'-diphospho)-2-C-methyl-D-erythritol kinase [Ignavibacteria bacterium]
MEFKLKSPAKINIGLRILSRRKDGYHNIETIFYPLRISDEVKVKTFNLKAKSGEVKVKTIPFMNINDNENICYKACVLFFEKFRLPMPEIRVTIKKKIPLGAGLGGGSSNAACVIRTLANVYHINLNNKHLLNLASSLGSDVPFFLYGKPSYAFGKGEKLIGLPNFRIPYKILLVNPKISISTQEAYNAISLENRKKKIMHKVSTFTPDNEKLMHNDFEEIVFRWYPEIGKIKADLLKLGAVYSMMSGSGSTVYGFFKQHSTDSEAALKYFRSLGYITFLS